ncbi:MAG: hypothetical protein CFE28_05220 [Alphaproteobacteria bacterium PA2]|nr:MAG: hypothetical protein CFE28_05220 [Alphaproteobacteria bacterium PA2]
MPLELLGLSLIFSIGLCVHVVRSGQQTFWLWIILMFQPLGGVVYLVAVIGPELLGGRTARRFGEAARETLDPHREYREARTAFAETPTVRNQSRLAAAEAQLGRYAEAERLYAEAAHGVHAEDPVLLLGRANALLELDRAEEALRLLQQLSLDPEGRTPAASLAQGRVYEALGRVSEAEAAYDWAAGRLPGLEGLGRQAAFLARTGRKAQAQELLAEMDRRLAKTNPQFRKEGRRWRDLAASAING